MSHKIVPHQCPKTSPKRVSPHATKVPYKSALQGALQDCPVTNAPKCAKGGFKTVPQKWLTRVTYKSAPQKYPTRASYKLVKKCLAVCFRAHVCIQVCEVHVVFCGVSQNLASDQEYRPRLLRPKLILNASSSCFCLVAGQK